MAARVKAMIVSVLSLARFACVAEWHLHTGVGSRVLDKTDAGFLQGPEGIHRVRIREITSRGLMFALAINARAERRNFYGSEICWWEYRWVPEMQGGSANGGPCRLQVQD